jgi:predicted Zn finger-like uncharacterized protein
MILTCPECATRYFLPDIQIGREGRKVKCAQCSHAWREFPQPDAALEPVSDQEEPPPPRAPAADPDPPPSPAAGLRAEILREKKAEAARVANQAATVTAAIWAGIAASVAIVLLLAAVFRAEVVRMAPGTAAAYAAVGLPVNSTGLLIEKVQAAPGMLLGHRALTVTGVLRNVAGSPVVAPAFRVDVLDKDGHPLDHKIIRIVAPPLKPGEARPFSLGVADPPAGYQDVAVTFALPPAIASAKSVARTGAH